MNSYVNAGAGGTYLSAYSIAVKHGFSGTEQEWLASIKGKTGDSIELKFDRETNMLCFKAVGESQWQEMMSLSDLQSEYQGATLQEMQELMDGTREQAQKAALSDTGAAVSASRAEGHEITSALSATLAQSWAVGETGSRPGENADNARYWADYAARVSDAAHAGTQLAGTAGIHGIRFSQGTLQCLENENWVNVVTPGSRGAFIVGTQNSGHTDMDCDFLCTGTQDEAVIEQALQKSGGNLHFLAGEYVLQAAVLLQFPKVRLSGEGTTTIFRRSFDSRERQEGDLRPALGMIHGDAGCQELLLTNLTLDGTAAEYSGAENACISSLSGCAVTLRQVTFQNAMLGFHFMGNAMVENCLFSNTANSIGEGKIRYFRCTAQDSRLTGKNCTAEENRLLNSELNVKGESRVVGNRFIRFSGVCLIAEESEFFFCTENYFQSSYMALAGFKLKRGIIGGNILQDTETGIMLHECQLCEVHNNMIYRSTENAESLKSMEIIQCSNCIIQNNILPGLTINESQGTGNIFSGNHTDSLV